MNYPVNVIEMKEKIKIDLKDLVEIIDSCDETSNKLYLLVKSKVGDKMNDFIDKIANYGYSDGIEKVELINGKIVVIYWAEKDK